MTTIVAAASGPSPPCVGNFVLAAGRSPQRPDAFRRCGNRCHLRKLRWPIRPVGVSVGWRSQERWREEHRAGQGTGCMKDLSSCRWHRTSPSLFCCAPSGSTGPFRRAPIGTPRDVNVTGCATNRPKGYIAPSFRCFNSGLAATFIGPRYGAARAPRECLATAVALGLVGVKPPQYLQCRPKLISPSTKRRSKPHCWSWACTNPASRARCATRARISKRSSP